VRDLMSGRRNGERTLWKDRTAAALLVGLAVLVGGSFSPARPRFHARPEARPDASSSGVRGAQRVVTRQPPFVPVTADIPPAGLLHAVTPAEVAAALDSLPDRWRETVQSVRLSYRPEADVMAETDGAHIELHYVVDPLQHAPVRPGEATLEEERFGGFPVRRRGHLFVRWPRSERLRTYVLKHLLVHEIGHHLAPPDLDEDADEEWAESFAFEYYCPDCDCPVSFGVSTGPHGGAPLPPCGLTARRAASYTEISVTA
jgi:hypothetical protein